MASQRDEKTRPTVLTSLARRKRSAYYLRRVTTVSPWYRVYIPWGRGGRIGTPRIAPGRSIDRATNAGGRPSRNRGLAVPTRIHAGTRAHTPTRRQKKHCHLSSISFSRQQARRQLRPMCGEIIRLVAPVRFRCFSRGNPSCRCFRFCDLAGQRR